MTAVAEPAGGTTRRALILRDSLTFVVLAASTVALFGVTLLLFHSFQSHRDTLAKDLTRRGRIELEQGKPAAAVRDLRAGLAYAPDDDASQLLLAQALAQSGDTEQANNYFLNLWAAKPGDGFLNLQLARLARGRGNRAEAVGYYRESIFGDWRGDGAVRRRDVRLELVDYLIAEQDYATARVELLIAAGNAPTNLHLDDVFAEKLQALNERMANAASNEGKP